MKLLPTLLFVSLISFGQQNTSNDQKRDSILLYLSTTNDSLKQKHLRRAMILSLEIENDSLLKVSSIDYGLESYYKRDTIGIKESYLILRDLYNKSKDSTTLAKEYHYKALKFRRQYKLDSSYYYYNLSKEVYILLKDSIEVGRRLLSMAYMQNDEKDYGGAESSIIEGLKYLEPLNEFAYTGDYYNILGNVLCNLNKHEEAREYYYKARDKFSLSKSSRFKESWNLHILNNIGYSYILERKYKKALEFFDEGLSFDSIEHKYPSQYQLLLGNSVESNYEIGEKDRAWKDSFKLLDFREKANNKFGQSQSHNGIAWRYMKEGRYKKALTSAKKAYNLAKEVNNNSTLQSALVKLIKLTEGNESKNFFNEYLGLRDKLYEREIGQKEQFVRIRYKTEETQKENTDLKIKTSQQQAQIEREEQQKIIGWLFSLAAVLALGFSFSIFRARRKKLMYEAQLQKATAREEERQQIAKSLHDEVAGDLRMLHQKLAKTELQGEAKSVEKIKDNVRNLSHQLSSVSFDEVSFKDQLINLISDNFDLDFRIKVEGIDTVAWEEVNNTIKRTLYLSIRESMQNTLKYAEANKFFIQFSSEKKEILLLLGDNGKGFEKGKGKKGIGLKNLKERVEEIQGTFEINSSEQGTQTIITIPINGR